MHRFHDQNWREARNWREVARCAGLLLILLAGCTVGPDFRPPAAEVPEAWRPTADTNSDYPELAGWWMRFDDPVLSALVDGAISENLGLREAGFRILEARAQLGVVRGDLFPASEADASYGFNKISTSGGTFGALSGVAGGGPGGSFDDTTDQWSTGLNSSWEIDVFGRLRRIVEAARADMEVSIEDYRDTMVILLADVAANYIDARTFQQRRQIALENLGTQQRTLELTEKRFRAELTNELDVAQAKANVFSTASEIPSLESGYRQAVNRLSVLLGHPPGWVDEMLSSVQPVPQPRGEIAIGIPADLLRRRPDIRGAERSVAAATARIGAAVGEMYPQFSITGNFGVDAQDLSSTFTWNSFSANLGPSVRWSVLNFGRLRNNVRAQGARQLQQVVLYQSTVLRAAEEVDNALVAYDQEKRRRESLAEAVAAYRRAVDLSQKQYARGTTSFQRVLDSQRSLLQFQDQLAISNANVSRNLVQLYRALGGGWRLPVEYPVTPAENHVLPPPD